MADFQLERYGQFNGGEILSIKDEVGGFWFTQEVVAGALSIDHSTVTYMRQHNPDVFKEGVEFKTILWEGRNRTVYSEEGFLTVCDLSKGSVAFALRRWMRQQFRVKHEGGRLTVQAKVVREDYSDLGPSFVIMQSALAELAAGKRRMLALERQQEIISAETAELKEFVMEHEERLAAWEDGAKVKPGEMTAIQLAVRCGWKTTTPSGAPHNLAVILAATNAGYRETGLMQPRREDGPNGLPVEVFVFTPEGVQLFLAHIDTQYDSGMFKITPNNTANAYGLKNVRYVYKV